MASTEKSSHLDTLLHLARSLALLNPSPWDKVVLHCIYVVRLNGKHLPYDLKMEEVYVADLIDVNTSGRGMSPDPEIDVI